MATTSSSATKRPLPPAAEAAETAASKRPRDAAAVRSAVAALLASTDSFVFDCDGVLYTPEGAIPGAAATLTSLRAAGKRCFFVTNSAASTRAQLQAKLKGKGIEADVSEIFGAAYLAACHLGRLEKTGEFSGKVYVSGSEALAQELRSVGLTVLGGSGKTVGEFTPTQMAAVKVDPEIKAVVVGSDFSGFCFYKIAMCVRCLVENPGCKFLLTNPDLRFPINSAKAADPEREGSENSYLPAAGAMAAAVSSCVGRLPTVCGKPSPLAMDLICAEHGIDKGRTTMVGDTLSTDIEFGNACGVQTVLVCTGNTSQAAGALAVGKQRPGLILTSVVDLCPVGQHQ